MSNVSASLFLFILSISFFGVRSQPQPACPTSGTVSVPCTSASLTISGSSTILNVNSGVTVEVTGTLTVSGGATINGTGATFNVGALAETNGSTNTINGGTYNTGSFSSGNGGSFSMDGATINISPSGNVAIAGSAIVIDNSTFTGVTNWTTNVSSFSMDGTDITASGSIQFEDASISNGTFIAGTSFSTTNGTNTIDNSTITAGTTASVKNTTFTDTDLDVQGLLSIESGNVSFDNGTINSGLGNAGTNDATAMVMNGGGVLTLTGNTQMNIRGSVQNNEWYVNNSDVTITGDFDNAGNEILEITNNGTFNVGGNFNNSGGGNVSSESGSNLTIVGNYDNTGGGNTDATGGTISVGGNFDNTNGNTDVDGGSIIVDGDFDGNTPTGDGGDCTGGGGGCCGSSCSVLPITLTDFTSTLVKDKVVLQWKTATEKDNDFFSLERSYDGIHFTTVAYVKGAGNTDDEQVYSYDDELAATIQNPFVYYQLSQTDFDGTHVKLQVNVVNIDQQEATIAVYPNPAAVGQYLEISGVPFNTAWSLYSLTGQSVKNGYLDVDYTISTESLAPGSYVLYFRSTSLSTSRKIIVKH